MMINKLSCLRLWEIIILNYITLGKTILDHNIFWEIIIPKHNAMWEKYSLIAADDTGQTQ